MHHGTVFFLQTCVLACVGDTLSTFNVQWLHFLNTDCTVWMYLNNCKGFFFGQFIPLSVIASFFVLNLTTFTSVMKLNKSCPNINCPSLQYTMMPKLWLRVFLLTGSYHLIPDLIKSLSSTCLPRLGKLFPIWYWLEDFYPNPKSKLNLFQKCQELGIEFSHQPSQDHLWPYQL